MRNTGTRAWMKLSSNSKVDTNKTLKKNKLSWNSSNYSQIRNLKISGIRENTRKQLN